MLRILGVHFIFRLAVLFGDGEDAQGLEGFERIGRLRVEHADAEKEVVPAINECQRRQGGDQEAFREDAQQNCGTIPFSDLIFVSLQR